MSSLKPCADDAASLSMGKLTIENKRDRMALYGNSDRGNPQRHG